MRTNADKRALELTTLEERYRTRARELYAKGSDDDIEIDDDAKVNASGSGAFVQAWVWVPFETEED